LSTGTVHAAPLNICKYRWLHGPATRLPEGLCPSDSPTRALARAFGRSLRSRGSFAALTRIVRPARCERVRRHPNREPSGVPGCLPGL